MRRLLLCAAAGFVCSAALGEEVNLSFNSDALRIIYDHSLSEGNAVLDGGWLYNSDSGHMVHAGLALAGDAATGRYPVRGKLGLRLGWFDGDESSQSGGAVAVGGGLAYTLPRYNRFTISGSAWFAPEITSFSDAEEYRELEARIIYGFLRQADVFVGARYIRVDYDAGGKVLFDTGMHLGVAMRF